jgi:hypothetical protein
MSQNDEDEVWEQILANAGQLSFRWDGDDDEDEEPLFPTDKHAEKINSKLYCTCEKKYPVPVQSFTEVYYTCSKNGNNKGCGKEIKDYKP